MPATARTRLIALLRAAHAGERAAAFAYRGHARSVRDDEQRAAIARIEAEEWAHRQRLGEMLAELGSGPAALREMVFWSIGRILGLACHGSGWCLPMYGAGWIEAKNVQEYVVAAIWASDAGLTGYARELDEMAACERRHEAYFRALSVGRWPSRVLGMWAVPTASTQPAPVASSHERAVLAAAPDPLQYTMGDSGAHRGPA